MYCNLITEWLLEILIVSLLSNIHQGLHRGFELKGWFGPFVILLMAGAADPGVQGVFPLMETIFYLELQW